MTTDNSEMTFAPTDGTAPLNFNNEALGVVPDNFASTPTNPPVNNTPPAQPPATVVQGNASVPANFAPLRIEVTDKTLFNDKTCIKAPLGTTISNTPIEKFKASTNKKELISVLTEDILAMKIHYSKDIGGNFQCFGGRCCEDIDLPNVRYVLPVVVYDTDKTGLRILSYNYSIKGLVLSGGKSYDKINTIASLVGDITTIDILTSCIEEKYQDLDFQQAGQVRWKQKKDMAQAIIQEFNQKSKFLPLILGRKMTEEQYCKKLNIAASVGGFFNQQTPETTAGFENAFQGK